MSDYSISAKITGDASGFTTAITKAMESLKELGKKVADSTSKISEGAKDWGLDLEKFYDKGSSIFKSFGVDIDQFASHFGASGALVAGITAVTVALQKLGAEMNEASAEIVKGTGATGDALIQLKDDMNAALVGGMSQDIKTVGTMIADINTRFGSTGEELTKLTDRFGEFATITGTDAKTAINSVADATKKWGLSNEEILPLMDQLTVASQASGASVTELLSGLKTGQAVFSQFGMSATESVALLSSLSASGVDTSTALTGLRTALANFSKEGINAKTGLEEVSNAIRNASTESEALNIAVETFGTKSGAEFVKILQSGTDSADMFMQAMLTAGGAVEQTAEASRTSKQAMTELLNSLKSTFSGFGEGVDNLLTDILDSFRNLVEWVAPVIQPIGKIFNEVFSFIGDLIKTLVSYFVEFQKRFNTVWKGVADVLQTTYEAIHKILGNVLQVVGDVFGMIFAIIDGKWEVAWLYAKRILLTFADNLANIMSWIVNIVGKGINLIIKPINVLIDGFNKVIETLNYIPGVSIPAAQKLKELGEVDFSDSWGITEALETVTKEIDDATGKSAETITANLGEVKTVSTEVAETVSAEWENAFKTMKASATSWEDKYLTQQIKLEKQALERAVELAKIEGKSEDEIYQIKKDGQAKINKLLEEQIDREKEKELAKIAEIEKITGVTEDTEALRKKIEDYYANERKQLYADDLSAFKKAEGEKAEIVRTNTKAEEAEGEKATEAKKEDYTWTIRLLQQDKERAKTEREKNEIQAEIYRLQKLQALASADINDYAKIELYYDTLINEALKEIKENIDKASEAQENLNAIVESGKVDYGEAADEGAGEQERIKRLEELFAMQTQWDNKLLAQKISMAEAERKLDNDSFEAQKYHIEKIYELKKQQLENERASALANIADTEENAELIASINRYYDNESAQLYKESLLEKEKYRKEEVIGEKSAWDKSVEKAKNAIGNIVNAYAQMTKTIANVIGKTIQGAINIVGKLWSGFTKALDFNPDDALLGLLEFEDKILSFFYDVLPQIPSFLASALQSVASLLDTLFEAIDFDGLFDSIADGLSAVLKKLPSIIQKAVPKLLTAMKSLAKSFIKLLPDLLKVGMELVKALFVEIPKFMATELPSLISGLYPVIMQLLDELPTILEQFVTGLTDLIVNLLKDPDKLLDMVFKIIDVIIKIPAMLLENSGKIVGAFIEAIPQLLAKIFVELPRMIGEAIRNVLQGVGKFFSWVWDGIKGLFGFENGTNSAPKGLAVVGEAGPELVNFKGGEQVINNRNTQKLLSDTGKGSVTINNSFYNTADTSAYQIMRQLNQQRRELAFNGVL